MNFNQKDYDLFMKSQGISGVVMHDYQKISSGINMGYVSPQIIEERHLNVASMSIFDRLMMDRIIFLGTGIDDTVANIISSQMLYLQSTDPNTPITLYIASPGGGVYAGNSILDTMDFIKPDVNTVVTSMAASMAFMIAINGKHRSALKRSRLMMHQPLTSAQGQATDILITAKQIELIRTELYNMISEKTNTPLEKVAADCERDYWMTAQEALDYGAIDEIVGIIK